MLQLKIKQQHKFKMKFICQLSEIPQLGARRVTRNNGGEIAIFRTGDDQVFALLDRCPHKGGPLSQGIVFGHKVACPLHNWSIGLNDGCATEPDVGCAERYAVELRGVEVWLDTAAPILSQSALTTTIASNVIPIAVV